MREFFSVYETGPSFDERKHWVTVLRGCTLAEIECGNKLVGATTGCTATVEEIVVPIKLSFESIPTGWECAITVFSENPLPEEAVWLSV